MQNNIKTRFSGIWKNLRKDFLKKNPSGTISQRPQSCIGVKCLLKWNLDLVFCNYDLIISSWDAPVRNIATISMLYDQLKDESPCAEDYENLRGVEGVY